LCEISDERQKLVNKPRKNRDSIAKLSEKLEVALGPRYPGQARMGIWSFAPLAADMKFVVRRDASARDQLVPRIVPASLKDYLITLCLFEAAGLYEARNCEGCGKEIFVNVEDGNSSRTSYCPNPDKDKSGTNPACRMKASRRKKVKTNGKRINSKKR
jgi:hypothetical protein